MIEASAATAGLSFFVWAPFLGFTALGVLWLLTLIAMQRPSRPATPEVVHRQFRPEPGPQIAHRQFRPQARQAPARAANDHGMYGQPA